MAACDAEDVDGLFTLKIFRVMDQIILSFIY